MVPGSIRDSGLRSPMHPLPLTEIESYGNNDRPQFLDPNTPYQPPSYSRSQQSTAYDAHEEGNRDTFGNFSGLSGLASSVAAGRQSQSTPHLTTERPGAGKEAKRQFSFTNFFGRHSHADADAHESRIGLGSRGTSSSAAAKAATEEERAGLVKGDSASDVTAKFPEYSEVEEVDRAPPPPPKHGANRMDTRKEKEKYEKLRAKWEDKELGRAPTWEREDDGSGGDGRGGNGPAYI